MNDSLCDQVRVCAQLADELGELLLIGAAGVLLESAVRCEQASEVGAERLQLCEQVLGAALAAQQDRIVEQCERFFD